MKAKVYSTEQIPQSTSGQLDYMPVLRQPPTRNTQDVFPFCLRQYVIAIYAILTANEPPCILILMHHLFAFFEIGSFVDSCKLSNLIAGCSDHSHHDGGFVFHHRTANLRSAGASLPFLVCILLHRRDVPHRKYSHLAPLSNSIASTAHSRHRQPAQTCLVLKESFSWQ